MLQFFINMVGEMKGKPFTMLILAGLLTAVGLLTSKESSFASEAQLVEVAQQVKQVQHTVSQTALENRLAQINEQLFNLNLKVADTREQHQHLDRIYYDKINELTTEKARVERELAALQ